MISLPSTVTPRPVCSPSHCFAWCHEKIDAGKCSHTIAQHVDSLLVLVMSESLRDQTHDLACSPLPSPCYFFFFSKTKIVQNSRCEAKHAEKSFSRKKSGRAQKKLTIMDLRF